MRFLTERGQNVNGQPNIIYVSSDNGSTWMPLHEFVDVCVMFMICRVVILDFNCIDIHMGLCLREFIQSVELRYKFILINAMSFRMLDFSLMAQYM